MLTGWLNNYKNHLQSAQVYNTIADAATAATLLLLLLLLVVLLIGILIYKYNKQKHVMRNTVGGQTKIKKSVEKSLRTIGWCYIN
jgi:uncharacterized protein HemX